MRDPLSFASLFQTGRGMPTARDAAMADLEPLLELFRASEVSAAVQPLEEAQRVWRRMLGQDGVTVLVSEAEGRIVATCMLITAPNLLRSGRGHAFLENVVTHPAFRGRAWPRGGRGRAVKGLEDGLPSCAAAKRQKG
jgi:ribosomal protein S18 acetylase RimI-like enzyme